MKKANVALFLLCVIANAVTTGCSGVRPATLGLKDNRLAPCPETPNCVSSKSADKSHFIDPLPYAASDADTLAGLKKTILGMNRSSIIAETDVYLHAEFTSAFWRFVDDVEFLLDKPAKLVQVRSASRLGRSDLGVNRRRVEEIRTRLLKDTGSSPVR